MNQLVPKHFSSLLFCSVGEMNCQKYEEILLQGPVQSFF